MYIYGELEKASLENLTSNPSVMSTGRIWVDASASTEAVIKYYDGNEVQTVAKLAQLETAATLVNTGNVSGSTTINWSSGLIQKVTLTADTNFSFSNPTSGKEHILIIQAASYYRYTLPADIEFHGYRVEPLITKSTDMVIYRFMYSATFQSAIAVDLTSSALGPVTALPGNTLGVAIHPSGRFIAFASATSPYVHVYTLNSLNPLSLGIKSANPGTAVAGAARDVAFSPDGASIAVVHATSPYISAYDFNPNTGAFGSKYSDAATLPAGTANSVKWTPRGRYICVGHDSSPYVSVYPWTLSGGFGTKITDPVSAVAGNVNGLDVTESHIYLAHDSSPYISVYPLTFGTGFGTKASDPATLPAGNGEDISVNPAQNYVAIAHATTPFVTVYPFAQGSNTFGTKVANPSTAVGATATAYGVKFSPDGAWLAVSYDQNDYLQLYNFSSGFVVSFGVSNGSELPGNGHKMVFSPDGKMLLVSAEGSPYFRGFIANQIIKNYAYLGGHV